MTSLPHEAPDPHSAATSPSAATPPNVIAPHGAGAGPAVMGR
jgi:hypothetical protein